MAKKPKIELIIQSPLVGLFSRQSSQQGTVGQNGYSAGELGLCLRIARKCKQHQAGCSFPNAVIRDTNWIVSWETSSLSKNSGLLKYIKM